MCGMKATKDAQEVKAQHLHLCNLCMNEFNCSGDDCSEFEFQTCPECKKASKRRRKQPNK